MAGSYHLELDQEGTTVLEFTWAINGTPVDLTGYSAQATGRRGYGSTVALFDLTSGSGIVLGGAAGTITVTWTDEVTDAITENRGVWELVVTSGGGARYSLLKGPFTMSPKAVG